MRVLLMDPPQLFLTGSGATRQVQPLGLAYVGAYVASDHAVRFLLPDTRSYTGETPWEELATAISAERPDVVGLTAVTATYGSACRVAELVKAVCPEAVVVLGGVHATAEPVASLQGCGSIDYVVKGEGEVTFAALLAGLGSGAGFDPATVEGLAYRDAVGAVVQTANRPSIQDLDALPVPLRDHLVWPQDIQPAFYQAMVTLRGCPYRCIYCAVPSSSNRLTRYRSAARVVEEIEELRGRWGIPYLFFHDSVFTLHRERTVAICEGMLARGGPLPFACQTRADRVDAELLDLMKEAGCHQIFFGIESGDVGSLKLIRKKMELETIRTAVALVKARGIRCTGFFMVGFPWETEALIDTTVDFACELDLDAVSLFSATPLPGTELWELAGGASMPGSIDFRTPQVNLTRMDDAAYQALYARAQTRVDAYNQAQMIKQFEATMAAQGLAQRSWLDG